MAGAVQGMVHPAARASRAHPHASRLALPVQGIQGRLRHSDFLEKTESGQLTFCHVPRLLPADFLACAQPQPDFALPPIFPWINSLAYIKINLSWV